MKSQIKRQGFALIISLSLMAFILLLLLSVTTFVQVETTTAKLGKDQLLARQNALLALQLAVGQLQQEVGPDQRVTARADILDTTTPAASLWTGSWKSYDPDDPDAHLGTIRDLNIDTPTWLVSGNDSSTSVDPSTAPTDKVTLLNYVDRNDLSQTVEVPRVATNSQDDTGGFAWWTSDESTKAKINPKSIDQSDFGTTINESQRRFMAPQKAALQTVSKDDWEDILTDTESLKKINDTNSLELLVGSNARNDFTERYSTDVTTHSLGLLVNNRKGGLRKDLTRGLDDQYEDHLSLLTQFQQGIFDDSRLLYSDTTRSLANVELYGDSWDTFFNYYNLYKYDYSEPSGRYGTIGNDAVEFGKEVKNLNDNNSSTPTLYPRVDRFLDSSDYIRDLFIHPPGTTVKKGNKPARDPNEYRRRPFSPIRPALVQVKISFGMRSFKFSELTETAQTALRPLLPPETDESVAHFFRFYGYPTFVICNPYNVQLKTGSEASDGNNRGAYTLYFTDQQSYYLKIGNTNDPARQIFRNLNDTTANLFGQLHLYVPDVTLEPGQVTVLGLAPGQSLEWPNTHKLTTQGANGDSIDEDSNFFVNVCEAVEIPVLDEFGTVILDEEGNPVTEVKPRLVTSESPTSDVIFGSYQSRVRAQVDLSLPEVRSHTNVRLNGIIASTEEGGEEVREFNLGSVDAIGSEFPTVFLGYQLRALTPNDSFPTYAHFNPIAYTSQTFAPYAGIGDRVFDLSDAIPQHDGDNAFWGEGYTQSDGSSRIILYDIPRQPMQSIGDLMHAQFGFTAEDPLYIVGNSYPSPFIEKSKTYSEISHYGGPSHFIDHSYYLNDRLFDEFFFSTVPSKSRDESKTFPYNIEFDQNYIDENKPLQNSRIIYNQLDGTPPLLDELQENKKFGTTVTAYNTAAANLLIDGPFNINSTSVDAWVAILSSHRDQELTISNASNTTTATDQKLSSNELDSPFTRFTAPRGLPNKAWTGFATLNDTEIRTLAIEIVNEIKARGPSFSLGDFINRSPYRSDEGFATRGVLQKAIDESSINNKLSIGNSSGMMTATPNAGRDSINIYSENLANSTAANIPGWLSQNDIVRQIAPIITTHGDTFKIRVYGDAKHAATNKTTARAYAEAVIQRIPNFIDNSDTPETELNQLTMPVNTKFGRRFQIVSIVWLQDA